MRFFEKIFLPVFLWVIVFLNLLNFFSVPAFACFFNSDCNCDQYCTGWFGSCNHVGVLQNGDCGAGYWCLGLTTIWAYAYHTYYPLCDLSHNNDYTYAPDCQYWTGATINGFYDQMDPNDSSQTRWIATQSCSSVCGSECGASGTPGCNTGQSCNIDPYNTNGYMCGCVPTCQDIGGYCAPSGHGCATHYNFADNNATNTCNYPNDNFSVCCTITPLCTTGIANCGSCQASQPYNTCGTAYGTQACQYTTKPNNPVCDPQGVTISCNYNYNNCDGGAGYGCGSGNVCRKTMGGKVTNSETGGAIGGVVIASNIGSATTDGNGNYREGGFGYLQSFSFNPPNSNTPCNNGYICNGAGAGSPNPALISGTVGGSGDCGTNCNFTYTPGHIGGHVYVDYSHDGTYNASEDTPIAGVAVTSTNPSSGNKTVTTDTNGYFDISYLDDGSHTVTIPNTFTDGNGHKYVGVVTSHTVTIGPNNYSQIFLITPLYEISGVIYNDIDKNQYYLLPAGSGDTPYTSGSSGVSIVGIDSATSTRSDGTFDSGVALRSGQYTITYSTLPANYKMTYPIGSTPPQLTVWIGTPGKSIACNNNGVHNAQCDAWGDIVGNTSQTTGVDFGITNEYSHTGGFCTDVRDENTIQDFIPNNPTCGVMSGAYVIYGNISCVPNPSVYYSGSTTVDFGYGKPNANNWLIGGATSENFSPVNPGSYRTSYSYINSTIVNGNIPTVDLSTVCTLTNCYLPDNLPDAIYKASSTVSFNGTYNTSTNTNVAGTYTFPLNKSYVFLVNGDINFYSKMLVPNGSTATFSDSGNINVEPNVGETSVTSTMGDLEGFYSADNSFNILSSYIDTTRCNPDGTTKDLRFNLIGSAVANVGGAGGTFNNMRDLCVSDLQCPAVTGGTGDGGDNGGGSGGPTGGGSGSTTGTDLGLTYILNAPDVIKHPNFFWQELTP